MIEKWNIDLLEQSKFSVFPAKIRRRRNQTYGSQLADAAVKSKYSTTRLTAPEPCRHAYVSSGGSWSLYNIIV